MRRMMETRAFYLNPVQNELLEPGSKAPILYWVEMEGRSFYRYSFLNKTFKIRSH